jgi:hypothetical protein
MGHNYKPTTITRVGFEYQDLVAIETLLAFYRDPARYQWVEIEASDPSFKAVDDVVACLADGRYELTQVKFAVDPDNPDTALDWDWLLAKKPKGKSLLQRWSDGVAPHVAAGKLATAQLKTDRKPDPAFNRCLVGQRVDYAKVPPNIRAKIETQLGSDKVARTFFGHFDFMHSQPVLENLEAALWTRISSDTDRAGFALFQRQVQLWATQKNWPHPDWYADWDPTSPRDAHGLVGFATTVRSSILDRYCERHALQQGVWCEVAWGAREYSYGDWKSESAGLWIVPGS